ncbi:hypothetical protein KFE98_16740 [bacterium SCSIO 12741]|nr:hypothetical protein KFE98_16740 [bacterium SCSIO 12741]
MKCLFLLLSVLLSSQIVVAQTGCPVSGRVEFMVHSHPNYHENATSNRIWITEEDYENLSIKDKLHYALNYPESYSQICYFQRQDPNEIRGHISGTMSGLRFSERQRKLLLSQHDSIGIYLAECVEIGAIPDRLMLQAMVWSKAWLCIPYLLENFDQGSIRNTEYLTAILLILWSCEDEAFLKSTIYQELYGSGEFRAPPIPYSEKTRAEIESLAMNFYQKKWQERNK